MNITKIIDNINRLISHQQIILLAIVTLIFFLLAIIVLSKFKKLYTFECLLFIISIVIIVVDFGARYMGYIIFLNDESITLKLIATYFYMFSLIISIFSTIIRSFKKPKKEKKLVNKDICGEYLYKNEVLTFNDNFFKKLTLVKIKNKSNWFKNCLGLYIGEEDVDINELGEYIRNIENTFVLKIRFSYEKELALNLKKNDIYDGETIIGYNLEIIDSGMYQADKVASSEEETLEKVANKSFDKHLQVLNEDIGYFDSEIDMYRLTDKLMKKLNLSKPIITSKELRNYIYHEDFITYDAKEAQKTGSYKYKYRLKTSEGIEWFEEVKAYDDGELISTFNKISFEKEDVAIFSKEVLDNDLEERINRNESLGIIVIYSNKLHNITRKVGLDATKVILNSYLYNLKNTILSAEDNIYKVANNEYCILFSNVGDYEAILSNITEESSILFKSEVYFEGKKYIVENTLGFVRNDDVLEKNALEFLEAGRTAVYYAVNKEQKFAVYSTELFNETDEFESYKVDLNNDFLKEI